jgi:hypothetical protein
MMKTMIQKVSVFGMFMLLAMLLSGARGLPTRAYNECERNTTWFIENELNIRRTSDTVGGKTTTTEQMSEWSEHHSTRGETWTSNRTHQKNADSTSHGHEESSYSDPEGKGCHNEDGEPKKFTHSQDDDYDSEGNTKRHIETIEEKDGKCVKYVRDMEWDRTGKLIKDIKSETEVPCVRTSLEVHWEGELNSGVLSVIWGPDTSVIPLTVKDKTYTGQFTGEWKAKLTTDACNCTGTFPVTIDVKGQEDEFEVIDFTVTINKGAMANCVCLGKSGSVSFPAKAEVYQFQLPAQGGATITMDDPGGAVTKTTFTLKMK